MDDNEFYHCDSAKSAKRSVGQHRRGISAEGDSISWPDHSGVRLRRGDIPTNDRLH
jgi:hypothetical protein